MNREWGKVVILAEVGEYFGFRLLKCIETRLSKTSKSLEQQSEPNRVIGKDND